MSKLPVEPPAGVTAVEWKAIWEQNEAALKLDASKAPAKVSPQQLLQVAEKADKRYKELVRQHTAACAKVETLARDMQEAKAEAHRAKAASLQAQVPSVGLLPCSAESLLEGILAKSAPHLVGSPEQAGLAEELQQLLATRNNVFEQRRERERAEAERAAAEAATAAPVLPAENIAAVGMDVDGLDDETLQQLDPCNVLPEGEDAELAKEEWRVAQRGAARKIAEQFGMLAAAKRPKTTPGG
jgi:hypothetical protein